MKIVIRIMTAALLSCYGQVSCAGDTVVEDVRKILPSQLEMRAFEAQNRDTASFLGSQQSEKSFIQSALGVNFTIQMLSPMISESNQALVQELENQTGLSKNSYVLLGISNCLKQNGMTVGAYAYTQQDGSLNQGELSKALEKTGSRHIPVNFRDSGATAKTINDQVEKDTNGLIRDLLNPSEISSDTVLGLLNTLHIKLEWDKKYGFKELKREFKIAGVSKTVRGFRAAEADILSMTIDGGFLFALSSGTFDFVVKYCPNGNLSQITSDELHSLYTDGRKIETDFWMPDGEINSTFDLKDALKGRLPELLTKKFDTNVFDNQSLGVDVFKQMAKVKWDHIGCEAAAATYMGVVNKCMFSSYPEQKIHVKGPFAFEIVSRGVNGIDTISLFSGQLASFDSLTLVQ